MRIKFSYRKFPAEPTNAFPDQKNVLKPVIPIRLIKKDEYIDFLTLIDSGADACIFPAELGEAIGLCVKNNRDQKFSGIGEGSIVAYFHNVIIEVGGWRYNCYAGFSYDKGVIPILGENGLLSLFTINFNLQKESIEILKKD